MDVVTDRLRMLMHHDQSLMDSGLISGVFVDDSGIRITLEKNMETDILKKKITYALADLGADVKISVAQTVSKIPHVKHLIAVMAGKGGVGKSTISFQLGKELARHGLHVGLLDADIYGPSIPQMIGNHTKPKMDLERNQIIPLPVSWSTNQNVNDGVFMSLGLLVPTSTSIALRGPMVHNALKQMLFEVAWGSAEQPLDFLVVDMPPGTGDIHLSILKYAKPDGVLLVSTPDILSLIDVERTIDMLQKAHTPIIGIIENMSYFKCKNCNHDSAIFDHDTVPVFAEKFGIPFLGSVPIDMRMRQNDPTMPRYMNAIYQQIIETYHVCA